MWISFKSNYWLLRKLWNNIKLRLYPKPIEYRSLGVEFRHSPSPSQAHSDVTPESVSSHSAISLSTNQGKFITLFALLSVMVAPYCIHPFSPWPLMLRIYLTPTRVRSQSSSSHCPVSLPDYTTHWHPSLVICVHRALWLLAFHGIEIGICLYFSHQDWKLWIPLNVLPIIVIVNSAQFSS